MVSFLQGEFRGIRVQFPIQIVDAFADRRFTGNPAAIVLCDSYPDDRLLQTIAAENNLAETAFPVLRADGEWDLRWFTPTVEVPLCGHATLASAWVLFRDVMAAGDEITFVTRQSGKLVVRCDGDLLRMGLPAKPADPVDDDLSALFGFQPNEVRKSAMDTMAVLDSADAVRAFVPDRAAIIALDRQGLIVTAPGDGGYDCVSRYFTPRCGIDEDPVTGAAHTMIVPYWARRLGKCDIRAFQASARGGELLGRDLGDRVELSGRCVPYLSGTIEVA